MVLFVFIDGVGAGDDRPDLNPLAARRGLLTRFRDGGSPPLPHGGRGHLIDATLGIPGRPQSATGQTALLTGANAPAALGRHLTGFPNAALRALLETDNLFSSVRRAGGRVAFLNAYHRAYLVAAGLPHDAPVKVHDPEVPLPPRLARPAATTVAARSAGLKMRTFDHVVEGRALYHDFTHRLPLSRGLTGIPEHSPETAGRMLATAAAPYDLAVYEYFLTDKAGHGGDWEAALGVVDGLERFLHACLAALDLSKDTLVTTSDHGNLEDLSVRTHTLNPVPLLAFGAGAEAVFEVRDLTGVAPLLTRLALA